MKKLMTMLAAAAMAFGLYAEGAGFIAGADFEGNGNSYVNGAFVPGFWNGDGASVAEASYTATSRSAYYDKTANTNVLAVKTTLGNPVSHYLNTGKTGEKISAGLYFDAQVNFTVFDKDDTPAAAEGKLAVFLQLENDDDSVTNFVVRAAGPNNTTNDFVCVGGGSNIAPGWHRLTIKMIDNVYKEDAGAALVGFVVYVDGVAVNNMTDAKPFDKSKLDISPAIFNMNGQLFASLEGAADTISSVAFDGQGQVDEIVLTYDVTKVSFAADKDGYVAMWNKDRVAEITIGGAEATADELALGQKLIAGTPAGAVAVVWTAKTGYVSGNGEYAVSDKVLDLTAVVQEATVEVTIDEATTGFADLAAAVAAINDSANGGTITLKDDQTVGTALATLAKDTVLDLNGETITFTAEEGYLFTVAQVEDAKLTITDNSIAQGGVISVAEGTKVLDAAEPEPEAEAVATFAVAAGTISGPIGTEFWANCQEITGGSFAGEEGDFYLAEYVADDKIAQYAEDYWTIVDAPKTFKVTVPDLTTGLTFVSMQNGDETIDPPTAGIYEVAEDKTFTVTYAPAANYKWTDSAETGVRTATAEGTITAPTATAMVYATIPKITNTFTYNGKEQTAIENGAGYTVVGGAVQTDAGNYEAEVALASGYDAWTDKTTENKKIAWSIGKAAVTVTADNKTIKVGDAQPAYTASVTAGEVYAGDTLDYTVACPTYKNEKGNYDIVVTPGTNPNYDVTPATGTLTVEEAGPVIPEPTDLPSGEKAAYDDWYTNNPADLSDVALAEPEDLKDAYLLGCKAGEAALEAARKEFKFASIEFKNGEWVATIKNSTGDSHEFYGNGAITVKSYSDVECKTEAENGNFFKATLGYKSAK